MYARMKLIERTDLESDPGERTFLYWSRLNEGEPESLLNVSGPVSA
jgi:hypothetical protein